MFRNGFADIVVNIPVFEDGGLVVNNSPQLSSNPDFCPTLTRLTESTFVIFSHEIHLSTRLN